MKNSKINFLQLSVIILMLLTAAACSKDAEVMSSPQDSAGSGSNTGSGTGGSMARFTISGDHLYTVNTTNMQIYNISNPADPIPGQQVNIGTGIETIYPYKGHLFIGSMNGMYI